MIRNILIYLDGSVEDETRIAHAEALMGDCACHVTGLYVNVLPSFSALPNEPGAAAILAYEDRLREHGAVVAARLSARLDRVAPTAELRKIEGPIGLVTRRMATEARNGDILVATCPYRGDPSYGDDIVEAVLLGAGRALYLAPPGRRPKGPIRTALVAWTDTFEAARAVREATPLLRRTSRTQLVFVKLHHDRSEVASATMADLATSLDRHGVKVEIAVIENDNGSIADAVLGQGHRIAADLVVAGAYGHSRWREWLVGGVTRELLARSDLPLLVAH